MNIQQKKTLKGLILKRNELYKLRGSRFKRILKDPLRTIPYFIIETIAYIHPFKVLYKTLWGDHMNFYLPEGGAIYYYGFFEANLTSFFINFLKSGDIFFDVGAHVGYYSMLASSLVENKGQVHSFEPTPRTFNTLRENVSKKGNITVNNFALMDKKTTIPFFDYGPKYSAFNSFKSRTGEEMAFLPKPEVVKVKTISLDDYCKEKNITPNIVKIDAEGAEHLILGSMVRILTDMKPIVTIEVAGGQEWEQNCTDSINQLKSYGYVGYEVNIDGYLKKHLYKDSYVYDNLVFVHQDEENIIKDLLKL